MADDKLKTGLEEQQAPESSGPAEPGGSLTPEQPAPEHSGPEALHGEDAPAAPSGKVIDLTAARDAGEKTVEAPVVEDNSPKHEGAVFQDLFGNEEKPPWEKSLDEIRAEEKAAQADQPKKRRGRPAKMQEQPGAAKKEQPEKGTEPRRGRPSKADKAPPGEAPSPALDKVVCTPSSRQRNNLHFTRKFLPVR